MLHILLYNHRVKSLHLKVKATVGKEQKYQQLSTVKF